MAGRDPALAAALFAALGAEIPCDAARKAEADALLRTMAGRTAALERVLALLCAARKPAGVVSLGKGLRLARQRATGPKRIDLAARYLQGPPWAALPDGQAEQDGIPVDWRSAVRADLLRDMGAERADPRQAERRIFPQHGGLRHGAVQCDEFHQGFRGGGTPFQAVRRRCASCAGSGRMCGMPPFPIGMRPGCPRVNSLFRDLLDAQIRKLEQAGPCAEKRLMCLTIIKRKAPRLRLKSRGAGPSVSYGSACLRGRCGGTVKSVTTSLPHSGGE